LHLFNRLLAITLLTFLTIFSLLFVMLPDQAFSETENRMLQKKPHFSWDNLISGKFSFAAENYLADQFAFRDMWVGIKSAAELVLQKKDNNGVYFGQDGYLLQKPEKLNAALLAENIAAINQFAENLSARAYFLLAPASVQVLDDKLPPFAEPRQALDLFALIRGQLSPDIQFIDTSNALVAHKQEYIYYKTDHHWTTRGAYYAYREAAPVLDFKPLDINEFTIEQASDNFYGTLHAKSGHRFIQPDAIQLFKPKRELSCRVEYVNEKRTGNSLYAREHLRQKDKYAVFLDGNHALLRITAQNQTGRKLLMIKDSYANSLVPFLTNHYDEIHIIDLRHFNSPLQPYIEQYGLSEILLVYNTISFAEDPAIRKILLEN
jgi:hypothetical protein